jgi:hypothetical protein
VVGTPGGSVAVRISAEEDADREELTELTLQLQEELLELDIDGVEQPSSRAPDGAKAAGAVELGSLVVSLGTGAISALVHTIQAWLHRSEAKSVVIEMGGDKLEIHGVSSEAEHALVRDWIKKHQTS